MHTKEHDVPSDRPHHQCPYCGTHFHGYTLRECRNQSCRYFGCQVDELAEYLAEQRKKEPVIQQPSLSGQLSLF